MEESLVHGRDYDKQKMVQFGQNIVSVGDGCMDCCRIGGVMKTEEVTMVMVGCGCIRL